MMAEDRTLPEISIEEKSSRMGWFASGFFVAALLIGLLLFTDGFFGGNTAPKPWRTRQQPSLKENSALPLSDHAYRAGSGTVLITVPQGS